MLCASPDPTHQAQNDVLRGVRSTPAGRPCTDLNHCTGLSTSDTSAMGTCRKDKGSTPCGWHFVAHVCLRCVCSVCFSHSCSWSRRRHHHRHPRSTLLITLNTSVHSRVMSSNRASGAVYRMPKSCRCLMRLSSHTGAGAPRYSADCEPSLLLGGGSGAAAAAAALAAPGVSAAASVVGAVPGAVGAAGASAPALSCTMCTHVRHPVCFSCRIWYAHQ